MALIKAKIFKLIDEGDFNQVKTHLAENPKQLEALTSVGSGYAKRKKITPLHYAIYHKKHDIVRGLIKLGANVHARDNYKRSILHTAAMTNDIDMVNIVLETDAPYLAPTPYRGKRNESKYIVNIAEKVATVYGKTLEEIAHITTRNSKEVFSI